MPRRPVRPKDIQNPDRILSNLLKDYVDGSLDDSRVLYRAYVVEVDHIGANLEEEPAPNPPGSIRARVITEARDKDTADEDLPVFWPLFPYDLMPVKPTEHVYVIFEDPDKKEHGLWISRIPEPNTVHNYNLTPGSQKYIDNPDNDLSEGSAAEQIVQDTDEEPAPVEATKPNAEADDEFIADEEVPPFTARVGDRVIHGSNNTMIVLGRDRPDAVDSGIEDEAGTIDVVTGRTDEADMNMDTDESRIYITMQSDGDGNFEIEEPALPGDSGATASEASGEDSYIVAKSNQVRVVARGAFKINVGDGSLKLSVADDGSLSIETSSTVDIKADGDLTVETPKAIIACDESALGSGGADQGILHGDAFAQEMTTFLNALLADAGGAGIAFGVPAAVQLPGTAAAIPTLLAKLTPAPAGVISSKHKLDKK